MTAIELKYCTHCRTNQNKSTFVPVRLGNQQGPIRGHKCAKCVARGKLPKQVRDKRGREWAIERRGISARRQAELKEKAEAKLLQKRREEKA